MRRRLVEFDGAEQHSEHSHDAHDADHTGNPAGDGQGDGWE